MENKEVNELTLIERISNDDQNSLEILFKEYYYSLCGFAKIFVKRGDIAEEIVADVFFRIWQNRKDLQIKSSLKAYLYTAIKNSSISYLNKRDFSFEELAIDFDIKNNYSHKRQSTIEYRELVQEINKIIDELPPQRKIIFKLSRINGLKYKEIADRMNISVNTVQKQMVEASKFISKYKSQFTMLVFLITIFHPLFH